MADLTTADLTEGLNTLTGVGTFDELMKAMSAHLEDQYSKQRIKGTDYANVYLGSTQTLMQQAVTYLLERDKVSKQLLLMDAQIALAGQDLLNKQKEGDLLTQQIELATKQVLLAAKQLEIADKELLKADADIAKANAEVDVLVERKETEYAQTHDTLSDGSTPVLGQLGKQNDVRAEQIEAFKNNHLLKTADHMGAYWQVQRTTDPGIQPSGEALNTDVNIGQAVEKLLESVGGVPDRTTPPPPTP